MPRSQDATYRYVGKQLSAILDERFITQDELAKALDVHPQNVSRWVRNETRPQKRRMRQIAEFLKVEPKTLLDPEPDEEDIAA